MASLQKRSLSGIQPSGKVHIGNYLGMIRPALRLQEEFSCLYFIADLHSLTTLRNPELLRELVFDITAVWLALGLDTSKHIFFRQSDLPHTELAWYLSCVTGNGLLEKAHAYKDAKAKSQEVNHGVFSYPILMAADILLYDTDIVPVGKDQKQHVEIARDIAGSFNAIYGEGILKLPEPRIDEQVMIIPGLDGRKMSKSYGNDIPLFCDEKILRKKILSITTDSSSLESGKEINGTLVGQLYSYFSTPEQYADLQERMQKGGMGWGHAKEELFCAINDFVKEYREGYNALRKDESALRAELNKGKEKAQGIAEGVLERVRRAVGIK